MATDPQFASTVNNNSATVSALETNLTVPTQSVLILTAGANGTKVDEVLVEAIWTNLNVGTVAALIYLFLYDGATYHLFDALAVTAVTGSATVAPFRLSKAYANLVLKSGWTLRASTSIAQTMKVHAFGADF